jgi:predicted dehydrogenase
VPSSGWTSAGWEAMTGHLAGRIRVGLVGASLNRSWGAVAHLPALAQLPNFEVTAVATRSAATANEVANAFGIPHALCDAHELACHPEVDLVVAAAGIRTHASVIRAALAGGKHVLSEWPLGVNINEAAELLNLANAAGVVHAVGLQGLHAPGVKFVRDILADDRIGDIRCVRAFAVADGGRPASGLTEPIPGASILTITGGHVLSVLAEIVGPVESLSASVRYEPDQDPAAVADEARPIGSIDEVAVIGTLQNHAVVSLVLRRFPPGGPDFSIEIVGTRGMLRVQPEDFGPGQHSINIGRWTVMTSASDGHFKKLQLPDKYEITPLGILPGLPYNLAALYCELADAIKENRLAFPSFHTAVYFHRLIETILVAARGGQRLAVADDAKGYRLERRL